MTSKRPKLNTNHTSQLKGTTATLPKEAQIRMDQMQQKIIPQRCYKCQAFGHAAYECKEKGKVNPKCLACGCDDHVAKNCTNEKKCYTCDIVGHRADGMKCEKYRQLVRQIRMAKSALANSST